MQFVSLHAVFNHKRANVDGIPVYVYRGGNDVRIIIVPLIGPVMCNQSTIFQNLWKRRKSGRFQTPVPMSKAVSHTARIQFNISEILPGNFVPDTIEKFDDTLPQASVVVGGALELLPCDLRNRTHRGDLIQICSYCVKDLPMTFSPLIVLNCRLPCGGGIFPHLPRARERPAALRRPGVLPSGQNPDGRADSLRPARWKKRGPPPGRPLWSRSGGSKCAIQGELPERPSSSSPASVCEKGALRNSAARPF